MITEQELKEIKVEGMTEADKQLINQAAFDFTSKDELVEANAIRGFLVQLCEENIIDDSLRAELDGDAASFSEGWEAAMKWGKG
jgi:hypothetical protein